MAEVARGKGESQVGACRRLWPLIFDEDAPEYLFACVEGVPATSSAAAEPVEAAPLVYVVEGGGFRTAGQTCGSVGMLAVPDTGD
jgi:hypothetical protein